MPPVDTMVSGSPAHPLPWLLVCLPLVLSPAPGRPILVVSDPEAFKQVFVTNAKNYKKDTW
jgi:hypothetical protein